MSSSIIYQQYINYSYTVARNPGTKADPTPILALLSATLDHMGSSNVLKQSNDSKTSRKLEFYSEEDDQFSALLAALSIK